MRVIFVFGSNLAGRHGKGAALHAARTYGAVYGVGEGLTGNAYAIPTKGKQLQILPLADIHKSVDEFLRFAVSRPDLLFMLTPVGCGLAGYSARDLWHHLQKNGVPQNVVFSAGWANDHSLVTPTPGGEGE